MKYRLVVQVYRYDSFIQVLGWGRVVELTMMRPGSVVVESEPSDIIGGLVRRVKEKGVGVEENSDKSCNVSPYNLI